MFTDSTPTVQPLGNNLLLKSISASDEIERLAVFNAAVHEDEHVADMTRGLVVHHPATRPEHWLFVEDESTGQIVSSLCLIPWTWRYEDVTLKAGEMGIVGTHPDYRRRGLIRALDRQFKTLLRAGGFDLSQIQGIPYYYRQFGYEYALPLEGGWNILLRDIPDDLPASAAGYRFRAATLDDVPLLARLYDETMRGLAIHAVRDTDIWRFLLDHTPDSQAAAETWIVLDADDQPAGYWRIEKFGFGPGLTVGEASNMSHPAAMAVLGHVKRLAVERGKADIRLSCADACPLVPTAKAWGAKDTGRYAWQIHLPDVTRLLRAIAPVLERRIAASPFAGLSETVSINMFRETYTLCFEGGKITAVEPVGFTDWPGGLSIPPLLFAPLVLGYRSREELRAAHPDVAIWGQSQYLIDVLFPKMSAFLYCAY